MSHIHLPDGVLPPWLWMSGYALAILISVILFRFRGKDFMTRRFPLLGMMAAAMVLGASVEIIPIAYHVNLTVVAGILLGPSLIFLTTFVVNVILALFGHGGVTVVGLNTLILSLEGVLGSLLFRLFWKIFRRLSLAAFLATFVALLVSTFAMIGTVSLGTTHYEALIHHEQEGGILGFELGQGKKEHPEKEAEGHAVNMKRFVVIVLSLGFIGWVLEGVITMLILKYIHRVRPDLLKLEGSSP
jgi:cobalt/nickel transport system permease protein